MKKQRKQKNLNLVPFFVVFAIIGIVLAYNIVALLGIDYWNWPVVDYAGNSALLETLENLEIQALGQVVLFYILLGVGMPVVATAAVDLYFGPK